MCSKRRIKSILSIVLSMCVACTMSGPLTAFAAEKAGAVYNYKEDGKTRIGIKAIDYDGMIYYDVNQGEPTIKAGTGNEVEFYKSVLTGEAYDGVSNKEYIGKSNQLDQWAELAEKIFVKNSHYSMECHASGSCEKNYGTRWYDEGYTDLSKALSSVDGYSRGSKRNDYTMASGLQYADSLMKVRKNSTRAVRKLIDTNALHIHYDDDANNLETDVIIENDGGKDNCMKALANKDKRDVLYTMVTCVDNVQGQYKYDYSSFVLAFYDFKLVPVNPDGIAAITKAEGYGSVEEAAKKGVPGVKYESTSDAYPSTSFFTNKSTQPSNASMTFTESTSETASNTYTSGKSYSFTESLEWGGKFQSFFGLGNFENKWKIGFSSGQVLNTSVSDTKSVSTSRTTSVTSSTTLPPQTAAVIDTAEGKVDVSLEYDCPVAVTYKVAMCSLAGELYADRAATWGITTAGYSHETFSTVFGCDSAKGGTDAVSNLYKRTVENYNSAGFEEAYGNTYGYYKYYPSSSPDYLNKLDWGQILGGKSKEDDVKVAANVEYREVDQEGICTGRTINSYVYNTLMQPGFEYIIEPANISEPFPYKAYDYTDPLHPEEKDYTATFYKGNVYEWREGKLAKVDNSFETANGKKIIADPTDKNDVIFYYKCTGTPAADDPDKDDPNEEPVDTLVSDTADPTINHVLKNEEIQNVTKWMGKHKALSASGGVTSYTQESKNSEITSIEPYYPLDSVLIENYKTFGDLDLETDASGTVIKDYIDGKDLDEGIHLSSNDKFYTRQLTLGAYNENLIPYYGFMPSKGSWKRVVKDKDGQWVVDTNGANDAVAAYVNNGSSTYIQAGNIENIDPESVDLPQNENGDYEVYFQYFINDKIYSSVSDEDYATNDTVKRDVIKLNVGSASSICEATLEGEYSGKVGEDFNLNEVLTASVTDATGKEVEAPVKWEAKQLNGITVGDDGAAAFTKPGKYDVRFKSSKLTSNWVAIEAGEKAVLDTIEFNLPAFKTSQVTLTNEVDSLAFDLPSFIKGYDQYGDQWTGEMPEISFVTDEKYEGAAVDENNRLVAVQPGSYKVYAEAAGYEIKPVTITVSDKREYTVTAESDSEHGTVGAEPETTGFAGKTEIIVAPESGYVFYGVPTVEITEGDAVLGKAEARQDGSFAFELSGVKSDVAVAASWNAIENNVSKVIVEGTLTGVTGYDKRNLNDSLSVKFEDSTGKEVASGYSWEVKELEGLKVADNGDLSFEKAGTYYVRAVSDTGVASKWTAIKGVDLKIKSTYIKKLYSKRKGFKATWKQRYSSDSSQRVSGYQLAYATKSDFSDVKTRSVKGSKSTAKTIKYLKAKKKYYVKIRTYKVIDGYKYYTSWSKVKTVKTR